MISTKVNQNESDDSDDELSSKSLSSPSSKATIKSGNGNWSDDEGDESTTPGRPPIPLPRLRAEKESSSKKVDKHTSKSSTSSSSSESSVDEEVPIYDLYNPDAAKYSHPDNHLDEKDESKSSCDSQQNDDVFVENRSESPQYSMIVKHTDIPIGRNPAYKSESTDFEEKRPIAPESNDEKSTCSSRNSKMDKYDEVPVCHSPNHSLGHYSEDNNENRPITPEYPHYSTIDKYEEVPVSHSPHYNPDDNSGSRCSSRNSRDSKLAKYDEVPVFDDDRLNPDPTKFPVIERPIPTPRSIHSLSAVNREPASLTRHSSCKSSFGRRSSRVSAVSNNKKVNGLGNVEFTNRDDEEKVYKAGGIEKWINILLCRGDLSEENFEAQPVSFIDLFKYASGRDKLLVIIGLLCAILSGIGQPIPMLIGGLLANTFIENVHEVFTSSLSYTSGTYSELKKRGFILLSINLSLGIFMIFVTFAQFYLLRLACQNIIATLRSRFIESILKQDAAWFDKQTFGAINSQLNERINCIKDGIAEKIALLVRGIAMFVTTLILAFYFNWRITLVMLPVAPLSCLSMSFMARLIGKASEKQTEGIEQASNILQEAIMNVRTVQSCNGQKQTVDRLKKTLKSFRLYGVLTYFWNGLFDGIFFFILYLFFALGLCYGVIQQRNEWATAGDVFVATGTLLLGAYFLGVMSPHLMSILKARVAAGVIYRQIERAPDIDCSSNKGIELKDPKGNILFDDVHFVYPSRRNHAVLKGISWTAEPGETLALVGHSGCGKSTSIGILTRLYDCTSGRVLIDGIDIRELNIHFLRRMIGIVQQEPALFEGTIYENIALGDPAVTHERVEQACRIANAHDFVQKLQSKYNTPIGQGSVQLSGGEKQRIAIARAILHNPPILLLDEATSALDAESEIHVQTALKEACRGRTTIVIAHRLSTLRDVQKIVVLGEGSVLETGSHDELAHKPDGHYAAMIKAQQFTEVDSSKPTTSQRSEQLNMVRQRSGSASNRSRVYSSVRTTTSTIRNSMETKDVFPESKNLYQTILTGGLFRLYRNCDGSYQKLIVGVVATVLRAMEMPFYVLIIRYAYRCFQYQQSSNLIGLNSDSEEKYQTLMLGIYTVGLASYCFVTIFAAIAFFGWATEEVSDRLKARALKNVLSQDAAYFDKSSNANAKLIKRINANSVDIKGALDTRLFQVLNNIVCSFVMIIMTFVFCWPIAFMGLFIYSIFLVVLWFLSKTTHEAIQELNNVDDTAKSAIEIIENARTIQLLTKETYFLSKYVERLYRCNGCERKISLFDSITLALTQNFMFVSDFFTYTIGISLIVNNKFHSIDVFAACQSMAMGSWIILLISLYLNEVLHAAPAANSLLEIVEAVPQIKDHDDLSIEPPVQGEVSVQDLIFAYPNRPQLNVADRLNLHAAPGQTVALVGNSGGGKSTVVSLLQRFYMPKGGEITVDMTPIRRFTLSYLRQEMALVGQEPILFSGSIHDNICMGVVNAKRSDVIDACQIANATNFIERLPEAYETDVGSKGSKLSGGQKQRIAIARALIRKPKILLLDEATSCLDAESEQKVKIALEMASQGRTTITIAHRLSSIVNADKIYFISGGKVVESGTHIELLNQDGLYAAMIQKQDLQL